MHSYEIFIIAVLALFLLPIVEFIINVILSVIIRSAMWVCAWVAKMLMIRKARKLKKLLKKYGYDVEFMEKVIEKEEEK